MLSVTTAFQSQDLGLSCYFHKGTLSSLRLPHLWINLNLYPWHTMYVEGYIVFRFSPVCLSAFLFVRTSFLLSVTKCVKFCINFFFCSCFPRVFTETCSYVLRVDKRWKLISLHLMLLLAYCQGNKLNICL